MILLPAIDLYEGKAVRLYKGDYSRMTVYSERPAEVALDFRRQGARCVHLVDLEGAKTGLTPNLDSVREIISASGLFAEIGGGIRSMDTVETYLGIGAGRVILGTAAVRDERFLRTAVKEYGDRIAVGVDIRDGLVSVSGWLESTGLDCFGFCERLQALGVRTVICTDISKDGAMKGANHELYRALSERFSMDIIASGGVSDIEDVRRLAALGIHGAIIGKAYYTGAIDLKNAIEVAE